MDECRWGLALVARVCRRSRRPRGVGARRSGQGRGPGPSGTLTRPERCAHSIPMRASAPFLLAAVALAAPLPAADVPSPAPPAAAAPLLDPDIREIVAAISPERIQRTIYVLASFKTRHTLSDPLASGDDIGGSMAWIRAEFNRVSAQAGGRLKVELDAFEQPPAPPRNPDVAQVTNIVATLPGADPDSEGRILVVCAHYDSRVTNPADAASPAPGADDDASGTAAVLELARVLSHFKFAATIVFAAFS